MYAVTLTLQDEDAVADFLEFVANLIRQKKLSGFNFVMTDDGCGRAAVEFRKGEDLPDVLRDQADADPGDSIEEADTHPDLKTKTIPKGQS
jgi:hypothetical protein